MFIFSNINCISICKLNHFIVDLSSVALIRCRDVVLSCGGPVAEIVLFPQWGPHNARGGICVLIRSWQ